MVIGVDFVWLIPAFPLLAVLINGLVGHRLSERAVSVTAVGSVGLSFLVASATLVQVIADPAPAVTALFTWIPGGDLVVEFNALIDPLTAVMMMVITGVGFLIHAYSIGYMHGDSGYARYFTYLNLFTVSMLILVMGGNYLVMFIGWEGVGLCSYLLIGFWYERTSAIKAGTKAFVVNRIGDAGFLVGLFLIFARFGSLNYSDVFSRAGELSTATATAITLCLFIGAIGKSAQLPLYTWLPDAMEGPTPVSALIHAATMVTAGVYMVVRNHVLFDMAPLSLQTVAVIGAATALFSATIGLVQYDIKRVLAYSTVSQLGYMFLACGVGAYASAIFHLVTHAFFKALLFMSAGSVIHAMGGEQDMRKMGGLAKHLPKTATVFIIGAIAIAGIPPLAGFWSKDEILGAAFKHGAPVLWFMGLTAAAMTSFYMFRQVYMTFYGSARMDHDVEHHLHESPNVMIYPLIVLAALSLLGGLLLGFPPEEGWIHRFLGPVTGAQAVPAGRQEAHAIGAIDYILMGLSVAVALAGWMTARQIYLKKPETAGALASRFATAHSVLYNKYWVDELYDATVVEPSKGLGRVANRFDDRIIDGIVNAVGNLTQAGAALSTGFEKYMIYGLLNITGYANHIAAAILRKIQSGQVHHYAALLVIGIFILVNLYLWFFDNTTVALLLSRLSLNGGN
ncbi:MAG: NADH-quinone oxidoreductase subunit L [Nitrospirae bacterium]|nr:NADH-quinone oxidoreductase subunit L [Nitrospirota bacterium]